MPDYTFTPDNLTDQNGNFILKQKEISDLLKFVWSGCFVATDVATIQQRTNLNDAQISQFQDELIQLTEANSGLYGHCVPFKDQTWPSTVDLSDQIYAYADKAGGDGDEDISFYAVFLNSIAALVKEKKKPASQQDPDTIQELTNAVNDIANDLVADIVTLETSTAQVITALGTFETDLRSDEINLGNAKDILDKKIDTDGDIKKYQQDIDAKTAEIKRLSDKINYEQYEINMAPTYGWIPIIGTIAAAVVVATYGKDIVDMEKKISGLQDLINEDNTEMAAEKTLLSDMTTISGETGELRNMIKPSVTTIEKMIGYWGSIKADLTSIQDLVQKDTKATSDIMAKLVVKKIMKDWDTLKAKVDTYRQMAYVANASVTDLEDYKEQLQNGARSFAAASTKDRGEHLRTILPRAKIASTTPKGKHPLLVKHAAVIARIRVDRGVF